MREDAGMEEDVASIITCITEDKKSPGIFAFMQRSLQRICSCVIRKEEEEEGQGEIGKESALDSCSNLIIQETREEVQEDFKLGSPFAGIAHPLAGIPRALLASLLPIHPMPPLLPPSTLFTLVLDLDETLVHSSFMPPPIPADLTLCITAPNLISSSPSQIYVCKRPGLDAFLKKISSCNAFELVIFTASLSAYADPVIDFLDPEGSLFKHRLYREACVYLQGLYIKDLGRLGRALNRTLLVDNSPISYLLHPEHSFAISSWFHEEQDTELERLAGILTGLAEHQSIETWRQGLEARQGHPIY